MMMMIRHWYLVHVVTYVVYQLGLWMDGLNFPDSNQQDPVLSQVAQLLFLPHLSFEV